jgi:hypothetical protein
MHPESLKNLELGKIRALDHAPGALGKVIGTRYPLAVEAELAQFTPPERSAFIRRWISYGLRAEAEG